MKHKPDWPEAQRRLTALWNHERLDRFVLPELELNAEEHGAIWYHLDGGDARQHLPRLLSLPFLKVRQYTPAPNEPPNGQGHLEMYRQAQAAGKIVHIELPAQNIQPLLRDSRYLDDYARFWLRGGGEVASSDELSRIAVDLPACGCAGTDSETCH